jgi:3-polyprenyl-4-hydroxybenzoate decarboxylase
MLPPVSGEPLRVRAPVVRIVDHGDSTTVIGPQVARRFDGDSAGLLRAVLEIHGRPTDRTRLLAELAARAGGDVPVQPVDQLVDLLLAEGVLVAAQTQTQTPAPAWIGVRRVVLGISGAVAAVDAPQLIRGLHGAGCEVRVALSQTARRFVSIAALDALTHHAVWRGIWQRDPGAPVPHVNLAEWAELVIVYPASATTVSRIATGDCSDLVSAIVTATRAPVVVVPSMNDAMYASPAVRANLETLRQHGRFVVHPALGIEVAHDPRARAPVFGPAPPAAAVLDVVRHVAAQRTAPPRLPDSPRAWEQLWSTTPADRLPWHTDGVEPALAAALDQRRAPERRLLDAGTGDGVVAIAAARGGFRVTATDVAPSALGAARARAGTLPIVFVLDDITATCLDGGFDVAVDRGLLHCLARDRWAAYATAMARLVRPGGALLLIAHQPGAERGTIPIRADDVGALLPGFELRHVAPSTLAGAPASLFELERRDLE